MLWSNLLCLVRIQAKTLEDEGVVYLVYEFATAQSMLVTAKDKWLHHLELTAGRGGVQEVYAIYFQRDRLEKDKTGTIRT
jgi:hypothetical protein